MLTHSPINHIILAAAVVFIGASQARATPVTPNGSLSGALIGGNVTTTSGGGNAWDLGLTTTKIQVTTGSRVIAGDANPYLGKPDNLLVTDGGVVTIGDPFTISNSIYNVKSGATVPFTVTVDGLALTLRSEVVTADQDGNIGLAFIGSVTADVGNHYKLGQAADLSIGFTESSPTGAIGVAYSIDTPENPARVPEPASLAILGLGIGSLGVIRARRKQPTPSLAAQSVI